MSRSDVYDRTRSPVKSGRVQESKSLNSRKKRCRLFEIGEFKGGHTVGGRNVLIQLDKINIKQIKRGIFILYHLMCTLVTPLEECASMFTALVLLCDSSLKIVFRGHFWTASALAARPPNRSASAATLTGRRRLVFRGSVNRHSRT